MWLDKPLYMLDARGIMMGVRAVLWSAETNGMVLTYFADKHDEFDEVNLQYKEDKLLQYDSELPLSHVMPVPWGAGISWFLPEPEPLAEQGDDDHYKYDPEKLQVSLQDHYAVARFILATWEFMSDQLPYRAIPDRAGLRRLGRSALMARDVLVVDLRVHENNPVPTDTHLDVEWNYRWRVRAHKRRWRDKDGNERLIDISSYVKGPADKPLLERDVLFKVRR